MEGKGSTDQSHAASPATEMEIKGLGYLRFGELGEKSENKGVEKTIGSTMKEGLY